MKMRTIAKILSLLSLFLTLTSCQEQEPAYRSKLNIKPEPYDLQFDRYEEVLFNLDTADFQQELMRIQGKYRVFLSGDLNNLKAVQYLKDFATDPFSVSLQQKVKTTFPGSIFQLRSRLRLTGRLKAAVLRARLLPISLPYMASCL